MSKKILIIEDDENIICLERDYLEAHGFEVLCANDGIRGLEIAKSVNISLVLLDIMLPSLNGLEVCKRIREFSNILPACILISHQAIVQCYAYIIVYS